MAAPLLGDEKYSLINQYYMYVETFSHFMSPKFSSLVVIQGDTIHIDCGWPV